MRPRCPHGIDGRSGWELNLPGHWSQEWPTVRTRGTGSATDPDDEEKGPAIA